MPTFVGNMVRVAWKMISGAWKGAEPGECFYNVWSDDAFNVWSTDEFNCWNG